MKRVLIFLFLTLTSIFLPACRISEVEWGWKAERPQLINKIFSHEVHQAVLEKEGLACIACHPMEIKIEEEREDEKMYGFSKEGFFPGKDTCHFCHYNPRSVSIAPSRCSLCHVDLHEIQPANHHFDWKSRHAVYAKADAANCEGCHAARYCVDCHERRDLPTRLVHDRNFRFVHGIEARVNPRSCGNCHQLATFCEKCHIEGGYAR